MAPVLSFPLSCIRPPSRLRPPPDPPPRWSPPLSLVPIEALSSLVPPEPPDPPDALTVLVVLVPSDTPITLFHTRISQIPTSLTSDDVVPFVTTDDTSLFSKDLYSVVCSMFSILSSMLVCVFSSISVCSQVDWYEMIVVWVSLSIWIMVLNCNVPLTFGLFGSDIWPACGLLVALVRISTAVCSLLMVLNCNVPVTSGLFGSDLLPSCGFLVALMRISTAVCSLSMVFNLAFGAVSLCFLSWWQFERKLIVWLHQLSMIMVGFHYPVASFVKLFLFPIFPPMWSEVDVQALPVLQGASFWLMLFSAFVAVFVTSQVTRDAFIQEGYEIVVLRFLLVFCNDVYLHIILCLINVSVCLAVGGFIVFSLGGIELF